MHSMDGPCCHMARLAVDQAGVARAKARATATAHRRRRAGGCRRSTRRAMKYTTTVAAATTVAIDTTWRPQSCPDRTMATLPSVRPSLWATSSSDDPGHGEEGDRPGEEGIGVAVDHGDGVARGRAGAGSGRGSASGSGPCSTATLTARMGSAVMPLGLAMSMAKTTTASTAAMIRLPVTGSPRSDGGPVGGRRPAACRPRSRDGPAAWRGPSTRGTAENVPAGPRRGPASPRSPRSARSSRSVGRGRGPATRPSRRRSPS